MLRTDLPDTAYTLRPSIGLRADDNDDDDDDDDDDNDDDTLDDRDETRWGDRPSRSSLLWQK